MRKTLVAVAVIAAGALAYYQWSGKAAGGIDMPGLEYVPADTVLLSAQVSPIDLTSYLSSLGLGPTSYDAQMQQMFAELSLDMSDAPQKFLLELLHGYMKALSEPESLTASTGIKAQMRSLLYMVGVSPVYKIEIADETAFWQMFDQAEQASGFNHIAQQLNDIKYRQYRLGDAEFTMDLLVTVQQGWATLTLSSDKFSPQQLALVLQAETPEQNLANTDVLPTMLKKYQLNSDSFAFISFAQLSQVLTTKDGNRFAQNLQTLFPAELDSGFAEWRTPACQADVTAITQSWPGIFMDNTFDMTDAASLKVASRWIIPTDNSETLTALNALRGFVPGHIKAPEASSLMHAAIGIDVAQLAPSIGTLWRGLTEPAYSCQPLAQLQQSLKAQNPLAALAMAGMVNGVQGISVTINDVQLDATTQEMTKADGLLTLSAANARTLLDGLKAFYPPLAATPLPAAGEELDLTTVIPELAITGLQPRLMMTDSHMLVFVGETAKTQAQAVGNSVLEKNGLLHVGMDYGQFFQTLESTLLQSGEPIPAEFKQLSDNPIKLAVSLDIAPQGVVIHTNMQTQQKPASTNTTN